MDLTKQKFYWGEYLKELTTRFSIKQFEKGRLDGQCGYDNQNIGHPCPCAYYHVGYICGTHERLLALNNIPHERFTEWVLVSEVEDIRFPLSSPAKYTLEPKSQLPKSESQSNFHN